MPKKKKATKKKQAIRKPRKVTVTVSKKTTIGKARKVTRGSGFYIKAAKDKLYGELGTQLVKKEKAVKKAAKRKIAKRITEIRRQINRLK